MNFIENESLAMQELLENYWDIVSKSYGEVFRLKKADLLKHKYLEQ